MASAMLSRLQNLWPFSLLKTDDLKVSKQLVHKLSIPEQTKQFVFALCEPSSQSVVYILAVQNLSEQSALDVECLIREVEPDAVVAQVTSSTLSEIQNENDTMDYQADSVPTSSFEVLKRCFVSKINKSQYESLAGNVVLREIFGVSFYGNFLAAKRAAKEVGSHFLLVESPYESACVGDSTGDNQTENQSLASLLPATYLIPRNSSSVISQSSKRFYLTDTIHSQKVKSLTRYMPDSMLRPSSSDSALESRAGECQPNFNYQAPPFAQSLYPLLADLHDMFNDLPAIRNALVHAQKMLADVNKGEPVKTQLLSEVRNFRFAVEGLRIALNDAARFPIDKKENVNSPRMEYNELPPEEKCYVLFAQALKNQTKNFKSSVAIVDAASLAGLRKHWNTPVPPEVAELAGLGFIRCYNNDNEETIINGVEKKGLLADKPMVAVGAGATAVIGASSLSKAVPASTLMKLVTYKLPVSLKLGFTHFQRTAALGISKILGSSKVLAPGVASAGAKASSTLKVTASSEKIRLVAHGIISFTERTSLLAMRTTFYQVMRNRHVRPAVFAPLTMFGCSMATCAGLLAYGDGIECAIESVPSAPMIASLGRGLQSLHQASLEVRQTNAKIQEALQSLMYNLNKMKPSKV